MKKLELALLGSPEFKLGNKGINDLVLRKGLALVAYLAVTKQTHSREALAGMFWGEMPEESARRNLRVALTKLRPYFNDHLIIQRRTVAFDTTSDYWLDVDQFEQALHQPAPSAAELQAAVNLYRGPFLADLPLKESPLFEDWIRPYQERLRQMAMDALYRLAVANTEQHHYPQGIDNLSKLLILEPWMEEAHRQLMLLLALSGQRTAALAQFETCQAVLDEELGVEPGEATVELYQKILNEEIEPADRLIIPAPPPTPVLIPFQAPAEKPNFIGRQVLLSELGAALKTADTHTIHALVGMGGIGKSTMATHIAHLLRTHFGGGVLWANAATSEPMSVLASWAQLYGYDFSRITDLESMAAAYRSVLADRHVLIVLDDVTSMTRIKPLLPAGQHCRVLVTTRDHDLARGLDARVWLMKELSLENGRLLLASILGEERLDAEPEAVSDICNLLENLPLAVEIIGQRLKSRPRRRLADMAERLRSEEQRLSVLQISDRAVRTSFAISFQALDMQLRRMFTLMGLFNGRSFTAESLAHIAELDRYEAEDRIFALTALSLAGEEGQTRYKQHALLADFALEKLGDEGGEEYGRFAQYYLHFAQQNQTNYDALRPEWDNMMAAMQAACDHQLWQIVIDFALALNDAWFTRARYTQARTAYVWAIQAAEANNDIQSQSYFLLHHGRACLEQRDYENAGKYCQNSLELCNQNGDRAGVAWNHMELARIHLEQSEFQAAQEHIAIGKEICQQLDNQNGFAEALYVEARIHYFLGDYENAKHLAGQAAHLQKKNNDINGLIPTLNLLATTALEQGDLETAEPLAHDALAYAIQTKNKDEEAMILDVLANVYRRKNELDQAQKYAERSLELLATMGDLGSQAMAYYQLSLINNSQGQLEAALDLGLRSLQLCRISNYSLLAVYVLNHIGDYYLQLHDLNEAREKWQEAMKIAEATQNPTAIRETERRLELLDEKFSR